MVYMFYELGNLVGDFAISYTELESRNMVYEMLVSYGYMFYELEDLVGDFAISYTGFENWNMVSKCWSPMAICFMSLEI